MLWTSVNLMYIKLFISFYQSIVKYFFSFSYVPSPLSFSSSLSSFLSPLYSFLLILFLSPWFSDFPTSFLDIILKKVKTEAGDDFYKTNNADVELRATFKSWVSMSIWIKKQGRCCHLTCFSFLMLTSNK